MCECVRSPEKVRGSTDNVCVSEGRESRQVLGIGIVVVRRVGLLSVGAGLSVF